MVLPWSWISFESIEFWAFIVWWNTRFESPRGAQNIMTSVKYFWLQMKKYFEKIICFQNMTSLKSENNFEKNYDFGILKTYFQKYFWLRSEKYFEVIIFSQNMISSKSDQKNIFYSDFNFCQIRKLKYFLTSIFRSQIRKIFSILISIFS